MSKKDYEAIAEILRTPKATRKQIALRIAAYFASVSRSFNRERFLEACNVEEKGK